VMLMNAFDTDFDSDNEVYAVNTLANHYMTHPIRVEVGRLVRMHVINVTEFDLINSFHLHGMFFDLYRTGTRRTPDDNTDTVMLCQGERVMLETRFRYPGKFMFHAHQSEFAELGWMGLFRAEASRHET
jgi:FtsP/CotA-like multicopper oxidase with cupredoxin domain